MLMILAMLMLEEIWSAFLNPYQETPLVFSFWMQIQLRSIREAINEEYMILERRDLSYWDLVNSKSKVSYP